MHPGPCVLSNISNSISEWELKVVNKMTKKKTRATSIAGATSVLSMIEDILSMSDVRGQGLFFSPLHGPLVSFCGSKILVTWRYFLLLCGFQNTDHVTLDCLLTLNSLALNFICKFFANRRAAKMLSRDQTFWTADWNKRSVKWAEKKPLSTDVWHG